MRLRRWAVTIAAVLAVVILLVILILPGLVRSRLESRIEALTGRETAIGNVDLNLFTRRLVVHDLQVHGEAGEPALATLARFDARFHLFAFLVRGAYILDAAELVQPVVRVVRTGDDRFNISELLERLAEPDEGPPLELRVGEATVSDGWLGFEDRAVSPTAAWAVEAVNAEIASVSTEPEDPPGAVTAAFTVDGERGSLRASDVRLRPAQGRAHLALREVPIGGAWRYIPADAAIQPVGGRITVRAELALDPVTGLHLDSDGTLTDLALRRRDQAEPWLVAPALTLVSRDVVYHDGGARAGTLEISGDATLVETGVSPPQRVPLHDTRLTLTNAAVPGPAPGRLSAEADLAGGRLEARGELDIWPFTARLDVRLDDAPLALAAPHVPADAPVQLDGGRLDADLVLALTPDVVAVDGDVTARDVTLLRRGQPAPFLREPALRATLEGLVARDGTVTLERLVARGTPRVVDATAAPALRYEVTSAQLTVARASYPAGPPAQVALEATLDDGSRLSADGTARLGPASARLDVSVVDLALPRLNAYLPPDAPVTVGRGRLGGTLDVRYTAPDGLRVDGGLQAEDVALRRREQADPLVEDERVQVSIAGFVMDDDGLALQRLEVEGSPAVVDATAAPPQRYPMRWMRAVVEDVTWPSRAPARVTAQAESARGATSSLEGRVDLATLDTDARVEVAGLLLERLDAYLPPDSPVRLGRGWLTATVDFTHAGDAQRITGRGRIDDLAIALRDAPAPFLTAPETAFTVDDLVVRNGRVSIARATVDGTPTTLALAGFGVEGGSVTFARSTAVAENLVLPDGGAASVGLDAALRGEGTVTARGTLEPGPRRLELELAVAGADARALENLLPLEGRVQGRLEAGLRLAASLADPAALTATGALTIDDMAITDGESVPVRAGRVAASGLEVRWPAAVSIAQLVIDGPSVLVDRMPDGRFPLRTLLARRPSIDDGADAVAASPPSGPAVAPEPGAPARDGVPVEIGRLALADGDLRFIDRTVTPAYSEAITDLSLVVAGLTTDPEQTADVAVHGIVGGRAALELRGEVAPFGEPFSLDVRGTLRDFPAPRTNPYVQHHTAWAIERGEVRTDVHYRIVGDELDATNRLVVERLAVTQMEAEARVEIPLGLIVSLLKDARGDIRLTVPVRGRIGDPEFDFGQAIGRAFKNVLTRLVTAPLRAIGRVVRSPDDDTVAAVAVDPVPFEPGSAVLTPESARHLHQVADVLRAAPFVTLRLTAPITGDDLALLAAQGVIAQIQRRQRERGVAFEDAAAALFTATFPDRPLPDTVEAMVATLREAAPPPDEAAVRALAERRLGVTRQALVEEAGVEPERLGLGPEPVRVGATGRPRVELGLAPS